ncbi:hypothetical protein Val02_65950 [Virgisporangium aliadipatigenens]|uniref:Lipoprotein n=1 Tax=Virgisporangium aliadipatigenens TaxID=741659 RepID=A0A8J3YQA3_9ACTN|nr:hypothetical protein [Virgisporangium aliadipatigenens]GIJ49709.1 hypothetical protein Val02_65950 [Virgisporangium aliadipatigenens]
MKRRILAGAALAVLLLTGAGCTDTNGSGSASGPSASAGSGSGASGTPGTGTSGGPASAADKQICDDTEALVAQSTKKFGEEVVKAVQGGGGEAAAVAAIKTLFAEWSAGMLIQSEKATNPELKSALKQYSQGLEKLNSQINTAADLTKLQDLNTPEIEAATEKVSQICG